MSETWLEYKEDRSGNIIRFGWMPSFENDISDDDDVIICHHSDGEVSIARSKDYDKFIKSLTGVSARTILGMSNKSDEEVDIFLEKKMQNDSSQIEFTKRVAKLVSLGTEFEQYGNKYVVSKYRDIKGGENEQ